MLELQVNGKAFQTPNDATLVSLLAELGFKPQQQGIALAVNDEVVPRSGWTTRLLRTNDRIEIIRAVQGG